MSQGIINVTLNRDGPTTPWGFRLHGGTDIGYPLTIQRVFLGSPSERELQRGDILLGINQHDVSNMMHMEAHDVIKSTGNQLQLVVHRLPGAPQTPSFSPQSPADRSNVHPLANALQTAANQPSFTQPSAAQVTQPVFKQPSFTQPSAPQIPQSTAMQPPFIQPTAPKVSHPYQVVTPHYWSPPQLPTSSVPSSPACSFQPNHPPKSAYEDTMKAKVKPQPYFMQKLPSSSYSKAPSAPMPRCASPTVTSSPQDDSPHLVNLQYNSPLGLYSKETLTEALRAQSGMQPSCRSKSPLPAIITKPSPVAATKDSPVSPTPTTPGALSPARPGTKLTNIVDITLSPTFQMIQEAENRSSSPKPEIPTPPPMMVRAPQAASARFPSNNYQDPAINAFGSPREMIHQSGSFKTLMATLSGNQDL